MTMITEIRSQPNSLIRSTLGCNNVSVPTHKTHTASQRKIYVYNHTLSKQQTVDATFSHVRLEDDAHHDSTKMSDDKFTRSRNAAGEPSTSR